MKTRKFLSLVLACCMFMSLVLPAGAVASADEELEYHEIDGEKFVTIDGETYQYISAEDFKPIDDPALIQSLNASLRSTDASSYLPVPPTYDYNLSNGTYSGSINLSGGHQWTPIFKRNIQAPYTVLTASSPWRVTASFGVFSYNAFSREWTGTSHANVTFSTYKLLIGSAGEGAEGLRIMFFDFDNSTRSFSYTLKDTMI